MKSGYIALGALGAVMLFAAAISPNHGPKPQRVNIVIHDEPYCAISVTEGEQITLRKLHHGQCVTADFR